MHFKAHFGIGDEFGPSDLQLRCVDPLKGLEPSDRGEVPVVYEIFTFRSCSHSGLSGEIKRGAPSDLPSAQVASASP